MNVGDKYYYKNETLKNKRIFTLKEVVHLYTHDVLKFQDQFGRNYEFTFDFFKETFIKMSKRKISWAAK